MLDNYLFFLVLLVIVAALVRDDFVFTVLYLFTSVYIIGRWWSRRALAGLTFKRDFTQRAFWGERVPVRLEMTNSSWLPLVWLRLHEGVPTTLATGEAMKRVISLGPRGSTSFTYALEARKRGYYPVGPLFTSTGDLLGLGDQQRLEGAADFLTVYPKIVHLTHLSLPSYSPMGTLRHKPPIYEDPTRVLSKRDYVAGDSLRRVDWKASATIGRLQVKQYEPSIALESAIFLSLNRSEYEGRTLIDATELAIVVAASVANWVIAKKQTVGLNTNGVDPLGEDQRFKPLPPRKGRAHLMRILDVLARVQVAETIPLADMLRQESVYLPWGTTLILVTGKVDERLFAELFHIRESGLNAVLILTGQVRNVHEVRHRAEYFGFPLYHFRNEADLDVWRR